ncbi:MAG: hypothetical protein QOF24_907 [Verrucomicrobiota bacterium]
MRERLRVPRELTQQSVIPSRADGEGPHNCKSDQLAPKTRRSSINVVGRKLIRTPIVRSHAVCAARDDMRSVPQKRNDRRGLQFFAAMEKLQLNQELRFEENSADFLDERGG